MKHVSPWWAPHVYADRREFLKARGRIAAALRRFFEARGFVEVETPCLQASPAAEAHLAAFSTELIGPEGTRSRLYLQTSPEFSCKKLLAAGEERLFTFARAFRNRERGDLHHPEFTMLEFYRARSPYREIMDDCAAILRTAAEAAGARRAEWRGRTADLFAQAEHVTVAEAFATFAGCDLLASLRDPARPDSAPLASAAARLGVRTTGDDTWSDLFSKILSERIEPHLGIGRPTFLIEYPACEAALARLKRDDPRVAERFELYVCGVELANGFGELSDAEEQRRRWRAAMELRAAVWGEDYPIDEDFLAALEIMPEASGVAVGFDRLAMLASGARKIEQVLWAPVAERGLRP